MSDPASALSATRAHQDVKSLFDRHLLEQARTASPFTRLVVARPRRFARLRMLWARLSDAWCVLRYGRDA